jgi:hypothetical protein
VSLVCSELFLFPVLSGERLEPLGRWHGCTAAAVLFYIYAQFSNQILRSW